MSSGHAGGRRLDSDQEFRCEALFAYSFAAHQSGKAPRSPPGPVRHAAWNASRTDAQREPSTHSGHEEDDELVLHACSRSASAHVDRRCHGVRHELQNTAPHEASVQARRWGSTECGTSGTYQALHLAAALDRAYPCTLALTYTSSILLHEKPCPLLPLGTHESLPSMSSAFRAWQSSLFGASVSQRVNAVHVVCLLIAPQPACLSRRHAGTRPSQALIYSTPTSIPHRDDGTLSTGALCSLDLVM